MPWAAIDPGASRNAVGIAVIDRDRRGMWAPIYLREIRPEPGRPLDLRNVLVPYAREVKELGCDNWATDGWASHDVLHAGNEVHLGLVQATTDLPEQWRHLLAICARDLHALGPSRRVPEDLLAALAEQLGTVREVFVNGRKTIRIEEVGTSHGDLASAYARAYWHARAADACFDSDVKIDVGKLGGRSRYDRAPASRVGLPHDDARRSRGHDCSKRPVRAARR
jgi:hypothetical protein